MDRRKKEFIRSGDNFKNYTVINDNYDTDEEFNLDSVIRTMKDNFDIDCDKSEAECIVDGAREFASYSDKFEIKKYCIEDEIHYKMVNLEKDY